MAELSEAHIEEVVSQLFETYGGGHSAPIGSLETLGKEFLEIEMEGRSTAEKNIVFLINKNVSKAMWLMGVATSAEMKAAQDDPENIPRVYAVLANTDQQKLYPAVITGSVAVAEFLLNNFELLCEEFKNDWPPGSIENTQAAMVEKAEEGPEIQGIEHTMLFSHHTLSMIRYFNLRAYEGLTGPISAEQYVALLNQVSRAIMRQKYAFNEKNKIKTNYLQ